MRAKADLLQVQSARHAPDGRVQEPEEQPARRVQVLDGGAPVALGKGPFDPERRPIGSIPGYITRETTAGEIATVLGTRCSLCVHMDSAWWQRLREKWGAPDASAVEKRYLELFRVQAIEKLTGGDARAEAVEEAMASLGVCRALTEVYREEVIVTSDPFSGCLSHPGPHGEDLSRLFTPRDAEARRAAAKAKDDVMAMALGRRKG